MDPGRLADWVTIHRSVKVRAKDPQAQGACMDQVLRILGFSFKVHWTLDSVKAPTQAEWHGRGPALSHALIRYTLSGAPSGPTIFNYVNEFHPPGGPLGGVASRVLIGHVPEHEAQHSLTRLKSLLESR